MLTIFYLKTKSFDLNNPNFYTFSRPNTKIFTNFVRKQPKLTNFYSKTERFHLNNLNFHKFSQILTFKYQNFHKFCP